MENVIALLTAFGLGSIVSVFIQTWLTNKASINKRNFEERKAAYNGLIDAYYETSISSDDENHFNNSKKNFARWVMRCELVAPKEILVAICNLQDINHMPEHSEQAYNDLVQFMKADLGVSK